MYQEQIMQIEKRIGYIFKNKKYLVNALTHSSYANENQYSSNERLEFLGDSVLNLVISDYIFKNYTELNEGELTRIRAGIVSSVSLSIAAKNIGLGQYLLLGKGEENTGGRHRSSLLADAFEAVIGSIYLDGGLKQAKTFILNMLRDNINETIQGKAFIDYKTLLQQKVQMHPNLKIEYSIIDEQGPDHDKVFCVIVKLNDKIYGHGLGKTKKQAEQIAAKHAIKNMEDEYE